jgi:hypothetical protein
LSLDTIFEILIDSSSSFTFRSTAAPANRFWFSSFQRLQHPPKVTPIQAINNVLETPFDEIVSNDLGVAVHRESSVAVGQGQTIGKIQILFFPTETFD